MRKTIILITLSFFYLNGFSQNDKKEVKDFTKNEIKLNALYLILGALDVTYERAINDESSIGSSITFLLDKKEGDINTAFALSPYYRFYFGKKPVAGFFMEGFSLYQKVNRQSTYYIYDPTLGYSTRTNYDEKVSAFALGIGLGGKWYTKRNVMFEINAGIGRNLSISSNVPQTDYSKITGKFGVTVGYRF